MTSSIARLTAIAGDPLSDSTPRLNVPGLEIVDSTLATQLLALLWSRNGFYALESALLVRPLSDKPGEFGITEWNSATLWRSSYGDLADGLIFFAEDLFGGQFALGGHGIHRFEPETGARELVAPDVNRWCSLILDSPDELTGWRLGHEWQVLNGPLPPGFRLVPRIPFVLGGEFSPTNLHAIESPKAMRFYGSIASQIRDAPDGTQVTLRVVD